MAELNPIPDEFWTSLGDLPKSCSVLALHDEARYSYDKLMTEDLPEELFPDQWIQEGNNCDPRNAQLDHEIYVSERWHPSVVFDKLEGPSSASLSSIGRFIYGSSFERNKALYGFSQNRIPSKNFTKAQSTPGAEATASNDTPTTTTTEADLHIHTPNSPFVRGATEPKFNRRSCAVLESADDRAELLEFMLGVDRRGDLDDLEDLDDLKEGAEFMDYEFSKSEDDCTLSTSPSRSVTPKPRNWATAARALLNELSPSPLPRAPPSPRNAEAKSIHGQPLSPSRSESLESIVSDSLGTHSQPELLGIPASPSTEDSSSEHDQTPFYDLPVEYGLSYPPHSYWAPPYPSKWPPEVVQLISDSARFTISLGFPYPTEAADNEFARAASVAALRRDDILQREQFLSDTDFGGRGPRF